MKCAYRQQNPDKVNITSREVAHLKGSEDLRDQVVSAAVKVMKVVRDDADKLGDGLISPSSEAREAMSSGFCHTAFPPCLAGGSHIGTGGFPAWRLPGLPDIGTTFRRMRSQPLAV